MRASSVRVLVHVCAGGYIGYVHKDVHEEHRDHPFHGEISSDVGWQKKRYLSGCASIIFHVERSCMPTKFSTARKLCRACTENQCTSQNLTYTEHIFKCSCTLSC